jgi:hypothetical protein
MVTPFEANSQLAYLSNNGFLDLTLTEDSVWWRAAIMLQHIDIGAKLCRHFRPSNLKEQRIKVRILSTEIRDFHWQVTRDDKSAVDSSCLLSLYSCHLLHCSCCFSFLHLV